MPQPNKSPASSHVSASSTNKVAHLTTSSSLLPGLPAPVPIDCGISTRLPMLMYAQDYPQAPYEASLAWSQAQQSTTINETMWDTDLDGATPAFARLQLTGHNDHDRQIGMSLASPNYNQHRRRHRALTTPSPPPRNQSENLVHKRLRRLRKLRRRAVPVNTDTPSRCTKKIMEYVLQEYNDL